MSDELHQTIQVNEISSNTERKVFKNGKSVHKCFYCEEVFLNHMLLLKDAITGASLKRIWLFVKNTIKTKVLLDL